MLRAGAAAGEGDAACSDRVKREGQAVLGKKTSRPHGSACSAPAPPDPVRFPHPMISAQQSIATGCV